MRLPISLVAVAFLAAATAWGQVPIQLPPGVRVPATPVPGVRLTPDLLAPPVSFRRGASATTSTDSGFTTRLAGTSFDWNFGGGAIPNTTTSATPDSPTVVLADPGRYTVHVTSHGASGAQEASWSYTVNPFTRATTDLGVLWAHGGYNTSSFVTLPTGEPVLVYCERSGFDYWLKILVRSGGTWAAHDATAPGDCAYPSAAVGTDGKLRVVFGRHGSADRRVDYLVARTAIPASPSEWTRSELGSTAGTTTPFIHRIRSDGRPVVAYGSGSQMLFSIATTATPSGPSDWSSASPYATESFGLGFGLFADRPAFAFRTEAPPSPDNGVRVALATSPSPAATSDFHLMTLPRPAIATQFGGYDPAIGVVDGRLLVAFRELGGLRLARANVAEPSAMSDFTVSIVRDSARTPDDSDATPTRVGLLQGRPTVEYSTPEGRQLAIARTRTPSGPADWYVLSLHEGTDLIFTSMATTSAGGAPAYLLAQYSSTGHLEIVDVH